MQLVGDLKDGDLRELKGCWQTAKSSIEGRPVVVDVTRLKSTDPAGRGWMSQMLSEGAQFLDGRETTTKLPTRLEESPIVTADVPVGRLRAFVSQVQRSATVRPAQAK